RNCLIFRRRSSLSYYGATVQFTTVLCASASAQSNKRCLEYEYPVISRERNPPAFLNKLYGMGNAKDTDPWVYWNEQGTSFIIPNSQSLAEQVLGRHYKHNRFASFVRHLTI